MRVTMAGATFPTNFDTNISEVMNPEVLFFSTTFCSSYLPFNFAYTDFFPRKC